MSSIGYSKLRSLTAKELVRALLKDGFTLSHQRGSHHRYRHTDGRRVTVAFSSPGDTFLFKTLKSMIEKQAKWTAEDLKRLGLI
jgi:predicted RNA binding protein YcfA (HicA-like mRNA interferase family)